MTILQSLKHVFFTSQAEAEAAGATHEAEVAGVRCWVDYDPNVDYFQANAIFRPYNYYLHVFNFVQLGLTYILPEGTELVTPFKIIRRLPKKDASSTSGTV